MAFTSDDKVQETTSTGGTITFNLNGAVSGAQSFVNGIGTTNTCFYSVSDTTNFEVGIGTVTSGTPDTLSRDTIISSSNSDLIVDFAGETMNVFNTVPASVIDVDTTGINATVGATTPTTGSFTDVASSGDLTVQTTAGLTAFATGGQGSATQLTSGINEIATCATGGDSVKLPAAVAGLVARIINNGAAACDVFPASGDDLGAGTDTAASLGIGTGITYAAYDTTNWRSV